MDRGQAHTLEAFMAALIVVTGLLFALGATAVTPLSASTSNQHIQNQQLAVANDLLATTDVNGSLREAVVYWDSENETFYDASDDGYYVGSGPNLVFWNAVNDAFLSERVAVNVYVTYWEGNDREEDPILYTGSPSDNAVTVTRTVILYNDTRLSAPGEDARVSDPRAEFYAPDVAPGSELYNVLEVRITAWRM